MPVARQPGDGPGECGALRRAADPARVALLSVAALFTNSVSEHDAGLRLPVSLPHLSSQQTDHRPNLLFFALGVYDSAPKGTAA